MKIVFHGSNAANYRPGFADLVDRDHRIIDLSDALDQPGERQHFESADVVVGIKLHAQMPVPRAARLFQAPAAGTDAIDAALLPSGTTLCNAFGHEHAIAEYVMAALLQRHVPLAGADADLRAQRWTWFAGRPGALRTELGEQTIGLLGYGHIAKAIAQRARAFGMRVLVANRSPVADASIDRYFSLDQLTEFMASADAIVATLPLTARTRSIVAAAELAAMRPEAVIVNVGRGPVIDEQALYDALSQRRIGGAVIDTWYQYPTPDRAQCAPSALPFDQLPNVLMTPHMSGWTSGMVRRRQQTMADNIKRLAEGRPLLNVVASGSAERR